MLFCDTFDWDDYPVFTSKKDFIKKYQSHDGINMQKIMEVYNLKMDKDQQLNKHRSFNFPEGITKETLRKKRN